MSLERPLESLSDDELLRRLADLLSQSRRAEADLVAHIAEVEARRLYAREAAPSMFVYCMDVLHLSEAEAWLRLTAARAAREHPVLLQMLADGRLTTGIARLAPHLTPQTETSSSVGRPQVKRQIEGWSRGWLPGLTFPVYCEAAEPAESSIKRSGRRYRLTHSGRVVSLSGSLFLFRCLGVFTPSGRTFPLPSRHLLFTSRHSLPTDTKSSSPPGPSYATSFCAFGHSCARRCRTAISPRSSRRPSPRSSSDWRPDDSVGRALPGRARPGSVRTRPPGIFRPRFGVRFTSAMEVDAASWTPADEDAPSATASSSTTGILSGLVEAATRTISA